MDTTSNSTPLLQQSNSDSEFIDEDYESGSSPTDNKHDAGPSGLVTSDTTDEDSEHLFKSPHNAPNDRFSFNYIVFYLMGIITLLPWNFFVTAEDVSCDLFYSMPVSLLRQFIN